MSLRLFPSCSQVNSPTPAKAWSLDKKALFCFPIPTDAPSTGVDGSICVVTLWKSTSVSRERQPPLSGSAGTRPRGRRGLLLRPGDGRRRCRGCSRPCCRDSTECGRRDEHRTESCRSSGYSSTTRGTGHSATLEWRTDLRRPSSVSSVASSSVPFC